MIRVFRNQFYQEIPWKIIWNRLFLSLFGEATFRCSTRHTQYVLKNLSSNTWAPQKSPVLRKNKNILCSMTCGRVLQIKLNRVA